MIPNRIVLFCGCVDDRRVLVGEPGKVYAVFFGKERLDIPVKELSHV